jgi:outer membrane protein assembly factor BamB
MKLVTLWRMAKSALAKGTFSLVCAGCFAASAKASDWPQFLGPNRNGKAPEVELQPWPESGLKKVWSLPVGQGFSGPVVADGKLILFHRVSNKEVVDCMDAKTSSNIWSYAYPTQYRDDFGFEEGPRATPAIQGGSVYSYGADGMISAIDFKTGKKIWSVDARAAFGSNKGFFGRACSPLITGDLLVLNIGGRNGAGIVALDKNTGKTRWKATEDEASYSAPIAAEFDGRKEILVLGRSALYGLAPGGEVLYQFPFKPGISASVTAATPLVVSNEVFITASYGAGAELVRLKDGKNPEKVWAVDEVLSSHYATPVELDGYLYGYDGRQEFGPALVCAAWQDGKPKWRQERFGAGTIMALGKQLLLTLESGELVLADASPDAFKEKSRFQALGSTVRAYSAWADDLFFARDKSRLICLEMPAVKPEAPKAPAAPEPSPDSPKPAPAQEKPTAP